MNLSTDMNAARGGPKKLRQLLQYERFRRRSEKEQIPVKTGFHHWLQYREWERFWRTL
jgi:hypothetical protein